MSHRTVCPAHASRRHAEQGSGPGVKRGGHLELDPIGNSSGDATRDARSQIGDIKTGYI